MDDAQGTYLYSNARRDLLTHIVIKHRHISRVIWLNTTQYAVYKTGDNTQLKQIYDRLQTQSITISLNTFTNKLCRKNTDFCLSIQYQKKNANDFLEDLVNTQRKTITYREAFKFNH